MKDEQVIGGILWLLGVATMFLVSSAVAVGMARDGLVLWDEAQEAVRALSTLSTLVVGAVIFVHVKNGREKNEEKE